MIRFAAFALSMVFPTAAGAEGVATGDVVSSLLDITAPALGQFEYFGEGRPGLVIEIGPNDDRNLVVQLVETGFLDDSVSGQRTTYTVAYSAEGWQVLSLETEVRCVRGETPGWQAGPCP